LKKRPLPAPELDTPPEFAARCNVSLRTIYRAIDAGQIIVTYVGSIPRIDPVVNMARLRKGKKLPAAHSSQPEPALQET
jgi:hypothetical protein